MYHLVTDLATLASLAEEATAMSWRKGDAARPGAVCFSVALPTYRTSGRLPTIRS
jgi:hypothetical protein